MIKQINLIKKKETLLQASTELALPSRLYNQHLARDRRAELCRHRAEHRAD